MRQPLKMRVDLRADQRWHAFVHIAEQLRTLVINRMALIGQCEIDPNSTLNEELPAVSDDCVLRLSPPHSRFIRRQNLEYRGRGIAVPVPKYTGSVFKSERRHREAPFCPEMQGVSSLPSISGCFPLEAYSAHAARDVVRHRVEDIFVSLLHELLERCQEELETLGADVGSLERLIRGGLMELSVGEAKEILRSRRFTAPENRGFGFDEERELLAHLGNRPYILFYGLSDLRKCSRYRVLKRGRMVYAFDLILPKVGAAMVGGVSAELSRLLPWPFSIQQSLLSSRRANARQMCGIGVSANRLLGFLLQTKLFFTTSQRSFQKLVLAPDQIRC